MAKYLYGASVQGIQEYIFETNKLKEIIGASELIKDIEKLAEKYCKNDGDIIMNAAGNIKIIFNSKEAVENMTLNFFKEVRQKTSGIVISQAVVTFEGDKPSEDDYFKLEERLIEQRNLPENPIDYRFSIIKNTPRTARAAYKVIKEKGENVVLDLGSWQKRERFKKFDPNEKEDLGLIKNKKGKIAVIHADGNSLGSIVPKIAKAGELKNFSKELDKATKASYNKALEKFEKLISKEKSKIRKVILGGDDMTCIIDADYALSFVNEFLKNFEKETKNIKSLKFVNKNNLTACAGIAIVNEKYPIYYAVSLAESLCSVAKKESKKISTEKPPSSVRFYNLQSGNFQSYELLKKNEMEFENISFDFGSYYINYQEKPLLDDFIEICKLLESKESPKTKLREWLKTLINNKNLAILQLKRINEMVDKQWKEKFDGLIKKFDKRLSLDNLIVNDKTPVFDFIQIVSNTDIKDKK
jgi:CRISPR/Cas system-associated protein Cas10 (large subunit of type III CRISPR-Cas system)